MPSCVNLIFLKSFFLFLPPPVVDCIQLYVLEIEPVKLQYTRLHAKTVIQSESKISYLKMSPV